jgi:hypothetical protein
VWPGQQRRFLAEPGRLHLFLAQLQRTLGKLPPRSRPRERRQIAAQWGQAPAALQRPVELRVSLEMLDGAIHVSGGLGSKAEAQLGLDLLGETRGRF